MKGVYASHIPIMARLLDPECPLRRHVRHLQIGPFKHGRKHGPTIAPRVLYDCHERADIPSWNLMPDLGLSFDDIVAILNVLTNLEDFSWHACCDIPFRVLATFKLKWPRARLHVSIAHRSEFLYSGPIVDMEMLSAPQLHSLHLGYYIDFNLSEDDCILSVLAKSIANSKTLKSLHIRDSGGNGSCSLPDVKRKHVMRIPSLESYTVFDHLREVAQDADCSKPCSIITNWNNIRHLIIRDYLPYESIEANDHTKFFTMLTGVAVNIVCLDIIIHEDFSALTAFAGFLNTIRRLKKIIFYVVEPEEDDYGEIVSPPARGPIHGYWNAVLNRHGRFLLKATIGPIQSSVTDWLTGFIEPLLSASQQLEELIVQVPWSTWLDEAAPDSHVWVSKYFIFPDIASAGL